MYILLYITVLKSEIVLHEAARKNSVDKVRQLIAEKVDINAKNHVSFNMILSLLVMYLS